MGQTKILLFSNGAEGLLFYKKYSIHKGLEWKQKKRGVLITVLLLSSTGWAAMALTPLIVKSSAPYVSLRNMSQFIDVSS
ncbi:MAG TPA: hypothetical protein VFW90_02935 [Candidatus Saccharimonadales bacterium]|nr:hypothetical protein [Candidatus Saccharimonadales bacterium]